MEGFEACGLVVAVVLGFGALFLRVSESFEGLFGDDVAGEGLDVGSIAEES